VTAALSVPDIPDDADNLTAALAYAKAGWFVVPVRRGTQNPGSLMGEHWQRKSSRDPKQLAAWFAGTEHDIALHCGRSGAVVFDVDTPDKVPEALFWHLNSTPPYQSTRPDIPGRGHYVFLQPPGRSLGNSTGRIGAGWGEVRGINGVIMAANSFHNKGGEYRWERAGVAPVLPDRIADQLDDASPAEDAATDEAVAAFIAEHRQASRPQVLAGLTSALRRRFEAGESRHHSTVTVLPTAMKEARLGLYPAQTAIDAIKPMFLEEVAKPPASGKQGAARNGSVASSEFAGILAWAVGQANGADLDEVQARIDEKMPVTNGSAVQFDDDGAGEDRDYWANAVRNRAQQIRIEREARAIVDAEALPTVVYPPVTPLAELLDEPDEAICYRIDQVAPKQGNIILSAQFKAGKTTLVNNLVRSLVDSDPFLGRFTVHQNAEHLVLIDDEMGRNTLRRWLREQNILNTKPT
jgi:hypothetical protein